MMTAVGLPGLLLALIVLGPVASNPAAPVLFAGFVAHSVSVGTAR